MKLNKIIFIVTALLCLTNNAHAYKVFSSYGSCKTWNDFVEKDESNVYGDYGHVLSAWLAGFVSALNMATGEENFKDLDLATIEEYVKSYCVRNPKKDAYDAVLEVRKKIN